MLAFKHKPCLGDVIYGLPVVQSLGGGILYLDPAAHGHREVAEYWNHYPADENRPGSDLDRTVHGWISQFNLLIPVLKQLNYIHDARIYWGEPIDIDLDNYYHCGHMSGSRNYTIVDAHYRGVCQHIRLPPARPTPPWLRVQGNRLKDQGETYSVVFTNNGRWLTPGTYSLAFMDELNVHIKEQIANVHSGIPEQEHIGVHRPVTSLLDWFELIDGCDLFIGNQSFPLSLAVGLGKTRMILEGGFPNCTFGHDHEHVISLDHDQNMAALRRLFPAFA